jgi:hypothetical protein
MHVWIIASFTLSRKLWFWEKENTNDVLFSTFFPNMVLALNGNS